jgi:hypothetical protein
MARAANSKAAKASADNSGTERKATASPKPAENTAEMQRSMILSMFFDEDNDADGFIALVDHCRIDLAACHGDVKQLPNVIAAHYRLQRGKYDIGRAASDLATFPPIAARIEELKAQSATRTAKR